MNIPFLNFDKIVAQTKDKCVQEFSKFIDSKWYVLGENVKLFEHKYATFSTTSYSVGVGSGLDALYLSLKALGIQWGDEVIVPSNTCLLYTSDAADD